MKGKRIFVVGSSNTDMVVKSAQLPRPGETILGGVFLMNAGGKGANQAVAAARLGGDVTFVAKVGKDAFGAQSLEGFMKEGIQTRYVLVDDTHPSGTALIMVNEEGENCIVVAPGANASLLPADLLSVTEMKEAAVILMQLEIPMETIEAVKRIAMGNHQRVMINPAPAQSLSDELLTGLFLITPNESEAELLTGIPVTEMASASRAADFFLNKGVENVVITMGKQGAYFKNGSTSFMLPAPVVRAVDTTAAGDTFSGALTVAITEGMDWEQAIRFAVKAA
ncbi:MAG TPA: ribokinase, partial [Chitinophagaceae bacterium]|nr:ribokinase [Chitinophagaceae bacterium]